MTNYTLIIDLVNLLQPPQDGTLSRTIHQDDRLNAVLFGFSPGQELSEHTASAPATLHFLHNEADVTLGAEKITATAQTWVHMPAQLPHSIYAKTAVTMLLLLLKQPASS
jgi:quercetin dioxygenase-like cupin family protein